MNRNKIRICENKDCQTEYVLTPNKPGKINVCASCGREQELGMKSEMKVPVRRKRILN